MNIHVKMEARYSDALLKVHACIVAGFVLLVTLSGAGCRPQAARTAPAIVFPTPEAWIQTELFFGLTRRDRSVISEERWRRFLDGALTPAFPDGFTVVAAEGEYLDAQQGLHREPARVVILLYPQQHAMQNEAKIRAIISRYMTDFDQEAVLRADSGQTVSMVMRRETERAAR